MDAVNSQVSSDSAKPASFAFIIHPIDPKTDVKRKYPVLGALLSASAIDFFSRFFPPVFLSRIEGVQSKATGQTVHGWLLACPLTPKRMLTMPVEAVYRKIVQTGRLAERLGAEILGLGAYTSVVGDAGITIARHLSIPTTTGDSYTVAIALEAVRAGAQKMDIETPAATAAVVGSTGAIGRVAAAILSEEVTRLILIGRQQEPLERLADSMRPAARAAISVSTCLEDVSQAHIVLTVTSALQALIEPSHLRSGAVVCDVSRPRDVSIRVAQERDDVLVIDGGIVQVPGPVNFGFNFGLPAGTAYACMAEVMILALEGRRESFTLGREISREQVETIAALGDWHGFRLAGFRAFDRPISDEQIERIRSRRKAA